MRLSNGIARLESALAAAGRRAKAAAATVSVKARAKRVELKLEVMARQRYNLERELRDLNALDRASVDRRVRDIQAISDATSMRMAEQRLRRKVADAVEAGTIPLNEVHRLDVSRICETEGLRPRFGSLD